MQIKKSNTLCDRPFVHLFAEADGEIRSCCIAGFFTEGLNIRSSSLEETWNSEPMRKLRMDMMAGVRNPICNVCYEREDRGEISPRLLPVDQEGCGEDGEISKKNQFVFETPSPDGTMPLEIQFLDIRFSNLCNQRCRMCNHRYSSQWYEDDRKMSGREKTPENESRVIKIADDTVDRLIPYLNHLKTVYFAGGEPLLMPEHYQLLSWLHDNGTNDHDSRGERDSNDIEVYYSSNLTALSFRDVRFVDLWRGFRLVKLSLSCDGFGEVGEYQRTGFNHTKFFRNLVELRRFANPMTYSEEEAAGLTIRRETNIIYDFQYTTTIYNVFHIFDFLDFMIDHGYVVGTSAINISYAWSPATVSLNNARDKNRIVDFLENGKAKLTAPKTITEINNMVSFIRKDRDIPYDELVSWNNRLDAIRGTDNYFVDNLS